MTGPSPWNRIWRSVVGAAAVAVLAFTLFDIVSGAVDAIDVAALYVAGVALLLQIAEYRRSTSSGQSRASSELADELAAVLREDWRDESRSRNLLDPAVIPLAWRESERQDLADRPVVIPGGTTTLIGSRFVGQISHDFEASALALARAYAAARRLVIIGEPGAGKSVLVLLLLLGLLEERDPGESVPVLLSISDWDPLRQDLEPWVVQTLATAYYAGRRETPRKLVRDRLLVPILDGLDEMPEDSRRSAIQAINGSLGQHHPLVLTSRAAEYEDLISAGGPPLRQAPVVEISAVGPGDAIRYLSSVSWPSGTSWDRVFSQLRSAPGSAVSRALSTPFALALAKTVYERLGGRPEELLDESRFTSRHSIEEHLADRVVDAAYTPLSDHEQPGRWSGDDARRWLTTIAQLLHAHHEQQFVWWSMSSRVVSHWLALVLGIAGGFLVMAAVTGWILFLSPDYIAQEPTLALGAASGAVYVVLALMVWFAGADPVPKQAGLGGDGMSRRWRRGFRAGAVAAGIFVAPAVLYAAISWTVGDGWTLAGVEAFTFLGTTGVAVMCATGLTVGVHHLMNSPGPRPQHADPLTVIRQDRRAALLSAFVCAVIAGVVVLPTVATCQALGSLVLKLGTDWAGWPPDADVIAVKDARLADLHSVFGDTPGNATRMYGAMCLLPALVAFSLVMLAHAWPRFVLARAVLAISGRLPFMLPDFLEDARNRNLLRLAAGAYQFRHARLQENLAGGGRSTGRSRPDEDRETRWRRRRTAVVAVGSVAVFLAVLAAPDDNSARSVHGAYGGASWTWFPSYSLSADRQRIAFMADPSTMAVTSANGAAVEKFEVPFGYGAPAFGADGRSIRLATPKQTGSAPGAADEEFRYAVWSGDLRRVVVSDVDTVTFFLGGGTALVGWTAGREPRHRLISMATGQSLWEGRIAAGEADHLSGQPSDPAAGLFGETVPMLDSDATRFVAVSDVGASILLDAGSGLPVAELVGSNGPVVDAAHADGAGVVTASVGDEVVVWRSADGALLGEFAAGADRVTASPAGDRFSVVSGGLPGVVEDDDHIEVWDVRLGQLAASFHVSSAVEDTPVFSSNGQYLVARERDGSLHLWDSVHQYSGFEVADVLEYAFGRRDDSADSSAVLAVRHLDGRLSLWGTAGVEIAHEAAVIDGDGVGDGDGDGEDLPPIDDWDIRVSADEKKVAVISDDPAQVDDAWQFVTLFDVTSGERVATFSTQYDPAGGGPRYAFLAFSAGQRYVAYVAENQLKMISADTGELQTVLPFEWPQPTDVLRFVQFDSTDSVVATVSGAAEVVDVWDVRSGRKLHELFGHSGPIEDFVLNSDGSGVVTWGADFTMRFWDI